MTKQPLKLTVAFSFLVVAYHGAEGEAPVPYGEMVTLRLIDLSPDRSLPIVSDPGGYVRASHQSAGSTDRNGEAAYFPELHSIQGWQSAGRPSGTRKTIDDVEISFVTNRPKILRRDARQIFQALGCMPAYPLGYDAPSLDTVGVGVFDQLVFVQNAFLGIVVLARNERSPKYEYLGQTTDRRLPLGEVTEYDLGDYRAFVFIENDPFPDREEWHPRRPQFIVFDHDGRAVYGDGAILRTDAVRVVDGSIQLDRNTAMLVGPQSPDYSVVFCPHGEAQYSLLDPVTKEPVTLQSSLRISYLGGELKLQSIELRLLPTEEAEMSAIYCEWLPTTEAIRDRVGFGIESWNEDRTQRIFSGTADAYLAESWESSRLFWSGLCSDLNTIDPNSVRVDPALRAKLDAFLEACVDCPLGSGPSASLGDDRAFVFLESMMP